jgi:antitoxin component YwqK of YwqJK toxin-antitoxin module
LILPFSFFTFSQNLKTMKKAIILSVFVLFIACTNNNSPAEGEMIPLLAPAAKLEPFDDGSGLVKATVYGTNGAVLEQGYYLNGMREGIYTVFHTNGLVQSTMGYVHGKKEGQYVIMDDRGQLKEYSTYHNDKLHGSFIIYNRNKKKEIREYKNGKLEGLVEKFYPNGKIMERTLYAAGQLHGVSRWYDQQGINTIAYEYNNGELIGDVELEAPPAATPTN